MSYRRFKRIIPYIFILIFEFQQSEVVQSSIFVLKYKDR